MADLVHSKWTHTSMSKTHTQHLMAGLVHSKQTHTQHLMADLVHSKRIHTSMSDACTTPHGKFGPFDTDSHIHE